MLLGILGVMTFSLTLPATRLTVGFLEPLFVSCGRVAVASIFAGLFLFIGKHRKPTRKELKSIAIVALGVVFGFPLLATYAMNHTNATHGGVVLGILPLGTAMAATFFSKERPSLSFWIFAIIGSGLVVVYSLLKSKGEFQIADLALLGAVVSASIGYAVGAREAKELGGLQVISWALLVSLPFMLLPAIFMAPKSFDLPISTWLAFGYVCIFSQFLAFLPWYKGLAMGGTAKVGQTQLLQPFFTIFAASWLLGESIDSATVIFSILVFIAVGIGRKISVTKKL